MKTRQPTMTRTHNKDGSVTLYYRGTKQFRGEHEAAQAFERGFLRELRGESFWALVSSGEQIVACGLMTHEAAKALEVELSSEADGVRVEAQTGWTLEELQAWARADVAPSHVLDADFVWGSSGPGNERNT